MIQFERRYAPNEANWFSWEYREYKSDIPKYKLDALRGKLNWFCIYLLNYWFGVGW